MGCSNSRFSGLVDEQQISNSKEKSKKATAKGKDRDRGERPPKPIILKASPSAAAKKSSFKNLKPAEAASISGGHEPPAERFKGMVSDAERKEALELAGQLLGDEDESDLEAEGEDGQVLDLKSVKLQFEECEDAKERSEEAGGSQAPEGMPPKMPLVKVGSFSQSTPEKATRSAGQVSPCPVRWQWLNDKGEWRDFDNLAGKDTESAYQVFLAGKEKQKDEDSVRIRSGRFLYFIDFDSMTQRNMSVFGPSGGVGKLRRIRRHLATPKVQVNARLPEGIGWEYGENITPAVLLKCEQDEKVVSWRPIDELTAASAEAAFQSFLGGGERRVEIPALTSSSADLIRKEDGSMEVQLKTDEWDPGRVPPYITLDFYWMTSMHSWGAKICPLRRLERLGDKGCRVTHPSSSSREGSPARCLSLVPPHICGGQLSLHPWLHNQKQKLVVVDDPGLPLSTPPTGAKKNKRKGKGGGVSGVASASPVLLRRTGEDWLTNDLFFSIFKEAMHEAGFDVVESADEIFDFDYNNDLRQVVPPPHLSSPGASPLPGPIPGSAGGAQTLLRGGVEYKPPWGWKRFAVRVKGAYDGGDNSWLRLSGGPGEWAVAYHGTHVAHLPGILGSGIRVGDRQLYEDEVGRGVYCTPILETAEKFAPSVRVELPSSPGVFKSLQVIIQCRVRPVAIKQTSRGDYWVVPSPDDVRPYGVLVRETPLASPEK